VSVTSSSALAERPRDACSTLNRKPVKIVFVSYYSTTRGVNATMKYYSGTFVLSTIYARFVTKAVVPCQNKIMLKNF